MTTRIEGADYAAAANPQTSPERLHQLARHPELRPIIAANPAAYPALREWIASQPVAPLERRSARKPIIITGVVVVAVLIAGGIGAAMLTTNLAHTAAVEKFCIAGLENELIGYHGSREPFSDVAEADRAAFVAENRENYDRWMDGLGELFKLVPPGDNEGLADSIYSAKLDIADMFDEESALSSSAWDSVGDSLGNATGWISRNCEAYY